MRTTRFFEYGEDKLSFKQQQERKLHMQKVRQEKKARKEQDQKCYANQQSKQDIKPCRRERIGKYGSLNL